MFKTKKKIGFLTYDLQEFTENCLFRIKKKCTFLDLKAYPIIFHKNQKKSRVEYLPSNIHGQPLILEKKTKTPEGLMLNINIKAALTCALKSDVIVIWGIQGISAIICIAISKLLFKKVVIVNQSLPIYYEKKRFWMVIILKKLLFKFTNYFIAQSPATIIVLNKFYKISKDKIYYIQFEAGSEAYFHNVKIKLKKNFFPKIEKKNNITNFLFVGNLINFKGLEDIFKAIKLMKKKNFRLYIVGKPIRKKGIYSLDYWKNLISFYNLDNIILIGPLNFNELTYAYRKSDVVLLPTYRDMYPKVIVEAAIMGKPIISTDASGAAEHVLKNNRNGFVIKPGDIKKLSQKMTILLDTNIRKKMGEESKNIAKQIFSADIETKGYQKFFQFICKP